MSKRTLIPTALHSELTEYSSLLRALRTSNTLDITAHITKAQPSQRPHEDEDHDLNSADDDTDEDTDEDRSSMRTETPVAGPSDLSHPLNASSAPQPQLQTLKRKRPQPRTLPSKPQPQRDAWTRWPLLADDVHVPEWRLEDEIAHMAAQTLKLRPHPPLPAFLFRGSSSSNIDQPSLPSAPDQDSDSAPDPSDLDPDPDAPSYIPHLTALLSTRLSSLLALLAQHTPARPPSMQNRIEPLTWTSVVDILASASGGYFPSVNDPGGSSTMLDGVDGLCDERMLKNIISRMERIYGPYNSPASPHSSQPSTLTNEQPMNEEPKPLHRLRARIVASQKLSAKLNALDASLFTIDLPPSLPPSHPPPSSTSTHSLPRTPHPAPSLPSSHSPPSGSSSPYNSATAENNSYVVPRLLAPRPDSEEQEGEYELEPGKRSVRRKKPLPWKRLERERGKWAKKEEGRTRKEGRARKEEGRVKKEEGKTKNEGGRKKRRVGGEQGSEQPLEGGKKKKPRLDPVLLQTERELSPELELEQGTARRSKRPRKEVNYRLKRRKETGGAGKADGGEEGQ